MMRVDAHVHFWDPARGDYGWLGPHLPVLNRRFAPADLYPLLNENGVDGVVLVQAAPTAAETDYLLELSAESWILAVVGWIDLDSPDAAEEVARGLREPKLVGVRPMLQDLADPRWILDSRRESALLALEGGGVEFDALIRPPHLAVIDELAARHPELSIVIDHAAKPVVGKTIDGAWREAIRQVAVHPNVTCKLSGLMTELASGTEAAAIPFYVGELLDAFGAERLIWGSDWPVLTQAASYAQWLEISERSLAGLGRQAREQVLGGNAARVYKVRGS
jgi:L-fuconolactonase